MRPFMQTFVLARHEKTFYLHSDIFQFQDYVSHDVVSNKPCVEPGMPLFCMHCLIVNLLQKLIYGLLGRN